MLATFFSIPLLDYAQFPTDCREGGAGSFKLFVRVGRRHLNANSRLAFRHHRVTEPHDIDPFVQKSLCHSAGERRVTQHDRDDGMLARNESESEGGELRAEEGRILT